MAPRRPRDLDELTEQLRIAFYRGEIASGGKVPSTREIARRLHISPTTALSLFKRLEDEGVLESRERSGTFLKGVGLERPRSSRDAALFRMTVQTDRRLKLLNATAAEFSEALLRASGEVAREDFKFAILMHREAFEMAMAVVRARLPRAAVVRLSPDVGGEPNPRAALARDPSIKCLLATYLYGERAYALARDFRRHMIVIRPEPGGLEKMTPSPGATRFVLVHDRQTADDLRRLAPKVFPADVAARFVVASLEAEHAEDAPVFSTMARSAHEVLASTLSFHEASERYGATKRVDRLPANISESTIEDMLFHYVFA